MKLAKRYLFAILASACLAISYGCNVVIGVAIVAMVNHTAIAKNESETKGGCPLPGDHQPDVDGPFAWNEMIQGQIRSAYFYGYLIAQIPGAILAERFSPKWILWAGNGINIILVLCTPAVALGLHWAVFAAVRVVMGIGGAVSFPAMHCMIAQWSTPGERGVMGSIVYGGTSIGTIGATLIAGYVAVSLGWMWIFYIIGILCTPWLVLWAILIYDEPSIDPFISPEELEYIQMKQGNRRRQYLRFPFRQIFSSCPFWALLVTHFCNNCGWYMYLMELPAFMNEVLHKNMKENAGMSAVPYVLMWCLSLSLGCGLDAMRTRDYITTSSMRKIATGVASIIPCGCMIGISFIGCNADLGMALIIMAVTSCGGMFVGFLSNHIDIAPNFAGDGDDQNTRCKVLDCNQRAIISEVDSWASLTQLPQFLEYSCPLSSEH